MNTLQKLTNSERVQTLSNSLRLIVPIDLTQKPVFDRAKDGLGFIFEATKGHYFNGYYCLRILADGTATVGKIHKGAVDMAEISALGREIGPIPKAPVADHLYRPWFVLANWHDGLYKVKLSADECCEETTARFIEFVKRGSSDGRNVLKIGLTVAALSGEYAVDEAAGFMISGHDGIFFFDRSEKCLRKVEKKPYEDIKKFKSSIYKCLFRSLIFEFEPTYKSHIHLFVIDGYADPVEYWLEIPSEVDEKLNAYFVRTAEFFGRNIMEFMAKNLTQQH